MTPGSSSDTAADHTARSWWRGRSLHLNHLQRRHHYYSFSLFPLLLLLHHHHLLLLLLLLLPPPPPSLASYFYLTPTAPLFLLVFANAPAEWAGSAPTCPPIIILTGFNLNNAACGFHRHARARLIISRTNSPTRYPSMVYPPPRPSHHYIFPLSHPPTQRDDLSLSSILFHPLSLSLSSFFVSSSFLPSFLPSFLHLSGSPFR